MYFTLIVNSLKKMVLLGDPTTATETNKNFKKHRLPLFKLKNNLYFANNITTGLKDGTHQSFFAN